MARKMAVARQEEVGHMGKLLQTVGGKGEK
jgi:hypothetical protein